MNTEQPVTITTKHRLEVDDNARTCILIGMPILAILFLIVYFTQVCHATTLKALSEGYSEIQQVGHEGTIWQKIVRH